jgi:hypothetical protein
VNLVISTTVGWNIGDQFILEGVKNLIERSWGSFKCVYHDRNPSKLPRGGEESHRAILCGWADALVIAGSPGWTLECSSIYRTALDTNTPIYMIGIGAGCHSDELSRQVSGSKDITEALIKAKLVICRDEIALSTVRKYHSSAELLPCPASMIPVEMRAFDYEAYQREDLIALGNYYTGDFSEKGLIAHQIGDLEKSRGCAFYSENVRNYFARYAKARSVVSSRLHASVVCHVFKVPVTNLWTEDDVRCASTWSVIDSAFKSGIQGYFNTYLRLLRSRTPMYKGESLSTPI